MRIAHITDPHMRHHTPGHAAIPLRRSREASELFERAVTDAAPVAAE